jgi:hypothetical protein
MPSQSALTVAVTVRLFRPQVEALKAKFPDLTTGSLIRSLLTLFLDGQIPVAHTLALREMDRAEEALKRNSKVAV